MTRKTKGRTDGHQTTSKTTYSNDYSTKSELQIKVISRFLLVLVCLQLQTFFNGGLR